MLQNDHHSNLLSTVTIKNDYHLITYIPYAVRYILTCFIIGSMNLLISLTNFTLPLTSLPYGNHQFVLCICFCFNTFVNLFYFLSSTYK